MDQLVKRKTVVEPSRPARKISGTMMLMCSSLTKEMKLTSSMKAANNKKQASEAEPTE